MNIRFEPNKIGFNAAGFQAEILRLITRDLDNFADIIIDEMRKEIDLTDTKGYFKEVVKGQLKVLSRNMAGAVITYLIGYPEDEVSFGDWMKAHVIAEGMGSLGKTGVPVHAGPPGRLVWDNMLDNTIPSTQQAHDLPDTWNHAGRPFVENAMRACKVFLPDILEGFVMNLPRDIVSRFIVSG